MEKSRSGSACKAATQAGGGGGVKESTGGVAANDLDGIPQATCPSVLPKTPPPILSKSHRLVEEVDSAPVKLWSIRQRTRERSRMGTCRAI